MWLSRMSGVVHDWVHSLNIHKWQTAAEQNCNIRFIRFPLSSVLANKTKYGILIINWISLGVPARYSSIVSLAVPKMLVKGYQRRNIRSYIRRLIPQHGITFNTQAHTGDWIARYAIELSEPEHYDVIPGPCGQTYRNLIRLWSGKTCVIENTVQISWNTASISSENLWHIIPLSPPYTACARLGRTTYVPQGTLQTRQDCVKRSSDWHQIWCKIEWRLSVNWLTARECD